MLPLPLFPARRPAPGYGAAGDPIRIGIVTTLSGANAGHGEYCKEGAELWKEDVNARGGILGRPVELVYEDNGETEQTYMNAMVKALSDDDLCAVYSNGYSNQITLVLPGSRKLRNSAACRQQQPSLP